MSIPGRRSARSTSRGERSAAGGASVFVFDNGRLIDDSSVSVSDEVRQSMRQQAFILSEEDRKKDKEKIAKSQELKQK